MPIIQPIADSISYFLGIAVTTDALWIIIPLALSTLLIMAYFGIYRGERPDWNTHLSNSFVLIFVSIALFRYIYSINNAGAFNFVNEWGKMLAAIALLLIGMILVRFNFEHLLPMKLAAYINSPITVNFAAFAVILLVYSTKPIGWIELISLLIIVLVFIGILILIKPPLKQLSNYLKKEKEKERKKSLKEAIFEIKEMKDELKFREKELKKIKVSQLEKQKKEAVSLKKIIKI